MQFKILKKIVGILGFKLIDKNLVKNNHLISNNHLYNIDNILEKLFENKKIKQLIQIGANDGVRFDTINKFIKKYSPHCILLEPIKDYFDQLKKNYKFQKNIIFENLAISVNNEINHLYKVKNSELNNYDEHIKGITSFDINHLKKHGVKSNHIVEEKIKNISISDLIKKYENKVDLLLIDTEGYDANIIIDLLEKSNVRPVIIFEYIHIKHEIFSKLLNLFIDRKYFYFSINENIVCFPEENKPKLNLIFN